MVAEGKFRDDLFYRLNVIPIKLPPLRERREDVPILMDHFIKRYFRQRSDEPRAIAARRAAGLHALPVAGQRPRARERLRAHRADLHL